MWIDFIDAQEPVQCGRFKTEHTQKMKRTLKQRGNYSNKIKIQSAKLKNRSAKSWGEVNIIKIYCMEFSKN